MLLQREESFTSALSSISFSLKRFLFFFLLWNSVAENTNRQDMQFRHNTNIYKTRRKIPLAYNTKIAASRQLYIEVELMMFSKMYTTNNKNRLKQSLVIRLGSGIVNLKEQCCNNQGTRWKFALLSSRIVPSRILCDRLFVRPFLLHNKAI